MIDVLLATYRPDAEWVHAQIDSIRAQTDVGVNLICREDVEGLGARENFSALLGESTADYVAFADQDDVWLPAKLAKCLAKLLELGSQYGRETPLLVFCDGYVTDETLKQCPGTVISRQKVNVAKGLAFSRLLMQNFIPGNAMLFNAALREKAGPVPEEAIMHDSWLALVAAAFGHIAFVNEPLYCYRQHGVNALGATTADARPTAPSTANPTTRVRLRSGLGIYRSPPQSTRMLSRIISSDRLSNRNGISTRSKRLETISTQRIGFSSAILALTVLNCERMPNV